MRIEYRANGSRRTVSDSIGRALIARRLARQVHDSDSPHPAQTYQTREMRAAPPDDLSDIRAEYQKVVGKRPFHGWDAAELRKRIAAAED